MKKTIITLMALAGAAIGQDATEETPQETSITLHGIVFNKTSTMGGFQNNENCQNSNYLIDGTAYGNFDKTGSKVGGLYITEGGKFTVNGSSTVFTINYLYMEAADAQINHNLGEDASARESATFGWGSDLPNAKIRITNGGWVDINNSFSRIDVSQMTTGGAIYLNTNGSLTLGTTLDADVTVYATITEGAVERTLISGTNYEGWAGNVVLLDANGDVYSGGKYAWEATQTGLSIVAVPEPTTATLSLLALAGLAARRRRK